MEQVDLVIQARWIIPVEPHGAVLDHHAIAIRDGRIVALMPATDVRCPLHRDPHGRTAAPCSAARPDQRAHTRVDDAVSGHGRRHVARKLARRTYLAGRSALGESRFCPRRCEPGDRSRCSAAVPPVSRTCTSFPDVVAQTAVEHNIRAVVGMIVINMPTAWAGDTDEYLIQGHRGSRSIQEPPARLDHLRTACAVYDQRRIHASACACWPTNSIRRSTCMFTKRMTRSKRPWKNMAGAHYKRLEELGLVNSLLTAVHMTQTAR